jgi:hypothetical protein
MIKTAIFAALGLLAAAPAQRVENPPISGYDDSRDSIGGVPCPKGSVVVGIFQDKRSGIIGYKCAWPSQLFDPAVSGAPRTERRP